MICMWRRTVISLAPAWLYRNDNNEVSLDCDQANVWATHVYKKPGFLETGNVNHGSKEMVFWLKQPWNYDRRLPCGTFVEGF